MAADLDLLDGAAAIEAWWWTCDLAGDFAQAAWRDRAADRAARLARGAGGYADGLLAAADRRLARAGRPPGQLAVSTAIETTSGPSGVAAATARSAARRAAARPDGSSERRNGA